MPQRYGQGKIDAVDTFTIVVIAVSVGVPSLFALIVGVLLFAGKARPVEGLGPRSDGPGRPATTGTWNAMVLNGPTGVLGGTLGATTGTFTVEHGTLTFTQDGSPMPAWFYPCSQLSVRANSAFSTAGVLLWTPNGHLRCTVSREHINRFTQNSIKTLREPRYYREFAGVLAANGARLV